MSSNKYYEVVEPDSNFRGRSYADWVVEWSNWLHSGDPDRSAVRGGMVFLRGNIDYYRFTANIDPNVKDVDLFYNKTGKNCLVISEDTAVLVPLLTSTRSIGETYNGSTLTDEEQVRRAAREDNDTSGGIYVRISKFSAADKAAADKAAADKAAADIAAATDKAAATAKAATAKAAAEKAAAEKASELEPIVKYVAAKHIAGEAKPVAGEVIEVLDFVKDYRIETPVFNLRISESNPFLKSLNTVYNISPGESPAVTDGFFVIIKLNVNTSYRIQFGGRGSTGSAYLTDSIYDIHVVPSMSSKLKDISKGTSNTNFAIATDNDKGIPDRTKAKAIAPLQLLHDS